VCAAMERACEFWLPAVIRKLQEAVVVENRRGDVSHKLAGQWCRRQRELMLCLPIRIPRGCSLATYSYMLEHSRSAASLARKLSFRGALPALQPTILEVPATVPETDGPRPPTAPISSPATQKKMHLGHGCRFHQRAFQRAWACLMRASLRVPLRSAYTR